MKEIQVLGTGCAKCQHLYTAAEEAAREAGIEYRMRKVTDIMEITSFGVMATPALAVDGAVKVVGRVPTSAQLVSLLQS